MQNLRKETTHTTVLVISILCLLSTSISANVNGSGEYSYDTRSDRGPEHWGDLEKEWAKCKYGKRQSPIAFSWWSAESDGNLGKLKRNHKPAYAVLKNKVHDVVVRWEGNAGSIRINGIDYHLENYHWHHPSEHIIDGKRFDLELHMVHANYDTNATYNAAVVAVLYRFGSPDPFLSKLEKDIKALNIDGGEKWLGRVDPRIATINGKKYYRYMGSLTTPPCSEGVIWTVNRKISTVSPRQVQLLKDTVVEEKNARPLQKINGRDVSFYDPNWWASAAE